MQCVMLRASGVDTYIWLGLVTNGSKNASTFRYTDNSPFINFPNFWYRKWSSPDGNGWYGIKASVAVYMPDVQYVDDSESNHTSGIVCYKPKVYCFKFFFLNISFNII